MKKLFSLLSKLVAFTTFFGVILYCIGYFFVSKTRRINELFSNKEDTTDKEE